MKKFKKILACTLVLTVIAMCAASVGDHRTLRENVLRLHVVANSDSQEDQALKLQVRDAVLDVLNEDMKDITDLNAAKKYIRTKLPLLEQTANDVLSAAGSSDRAVVTLGQEEFPTRQYDTFTLPAGVYESLRIRIGEAEGRNWWCVVFPTLCVPATTDGFRAEAAGSGFSRTLTDTLTGEPGYEIRFFFLDLIGRIENFFCRG